MSVGVGVPVSVAAGVLVDVLVGALEGTGVSDGVGVEDAVNAAAVWHVGLLTAVVQFGAACMPTTLAVDIARANAQDKTTKTIAETK